ncbi:response regulator transcription factor [Viridibacillus sp. YIM B01967]|uniref:Response regulator transcription factor n=1 Tax=Viridibacillus soli TaxID=2798301 RepID=A0ABS1H7Z4_9BACL|nr:response regulator transcription factor [Viridibacillus soli]MBK3495520.1 response regulator transcription factor [Viridibacillus soli]
MSERILIIEDEEKIARVLQLELEFEGYATGIAHTGTDGLILYREQQWDLVLLDVMLPGLNGLDVLKRIRATEFNTPVIMLTAKGDVEDKVTGLDLGANDYMTKPFEIDELLARIRVALRFNTSQQEAKVKQDEFFHEYAGLSIHEQTREVIRDEYSIDLTPREYGLLLYLIKHPKQVLSREQILDAIWGYDYYGDTNVVDVYIRYVRQKVDKKSKNTLIQTVRGVGYVLKEQVNEA